MSREYRIRILIDEKFDAKLREDLEEILVTECIDNFSSGAADFFEAIGDYSLGSGRTLDQEVRRLKELLWSAIGRYVKIGIFTISLEWEYQGCHQGEYERWINRGGCPMPRCSMCGYLIKKSEARLKETDREDLCWRCEDLCSCGEKIGSDDPDERKCASCRAGDAEFKGDISNGK